MHLNSETKHRNVKSIPHQLANHFVSAVPPVAYTKVLLNLSLIHALRKKKKLLEEIQSLEEEPREWEGMEANRKQLRNPREIECDVTRGLVLSCTILM